MDKLSFCEQQIGIEVKNKIHRVLVDSNLKLDFVLKNTWFFIVTKFKFPEELPTDINFFKWTQLNNNKFATQFKFKFSNIDYKLVINISYNSDWTAILMEEMFESYIFFLENLDKNIFLKISDISIISPKQELWWDSWNCTQSLYDEKSTLSERFKKVANSIPEATALISKSRSFTYGELDYFSDQIAKNLLSKNLAPESIVVILESRGWELVVAILGILKAGLSYLPLNNKEPAERINFIIDETKPSLILSQSECSKNIFVKSIDIQNINLENQTLNGNSIAYLIYTSGSTGKPKGVAITHKAVINTLDDLIDRLNLGTQDRILSLSELSFDLSIFDLFGCFMSGASIVLLDDVESKNPEVWLDLIYRHKITVWNTVPALMDLLISYIEIIATKDHIQLLPLRWILLSGDLIPQNFPKRIKKFINLECRILQLGGSTEASIWSIGSEITDWNSLASVPYGKPLRNQKIYTVDDNNLLLPPGAVGEIIISGVGLAACYWGNSALTAVRFPDIPKIGRVFKTQDSGCINLNTGLMEFLGRLDKQAKVLGNRIDLIEIENSLCDIKSIESAIVLTLDKNHKKKLVAILKHNKAKKIFSDKEIKRQLSRKLSLTMIPEKYIWIEKWPLTSNGKIDVKFLSNIIIGKNEIGTEDHEIKKSQYISLKDELISFIPPNQKGMLYEWLKREKGTYSIAITLHYNIAINQKIFHNACQQLLIEFDALRQFFKQVDSSESFNLLISPCFSVPYIYFDWSNKSDIEITEWLKVRKNNNMNAGINPFQSRAFHIEHFHFSNNKNEVHFYYNHLLLDAGSVTHLVNRLHQIYHKNSNIVVQPSVKEFLNFRSNYDITEHLDFWKNELSQLKALEATLITKKLFYAESSLHFSDAHEPRAFLLSLNQWEKDEIHKFSVIHKVSGVTFLQGCWSLLLSFWLDKTHVISGFVYSGKSKLPRDWNNHVGCFINTFPLIIETNPETPFLDWIKSIKKSIQRLMKHDIVSLLEISQLNEINISEYFDSVFSALSFRRPDLEKFPGFKKIKYDQITNFPLTIQFDPVEMEILLKFQSHSSSAEQESLIVASYHWIIKQALKTEKKQLKNFTLFEAQGKTVENLAIVYGKKQAKKLDVITIFYEQAVKHPQAIAVVFDKVDITYAQLLEKIECFASYLKVHAVNTVLGIMLPRGESWIVAILGCLLAHVPFMPIALDWPNSRLKKILEETECHNILVENDLIIDSMTSLIFHNYADVLKNQCVFQRVEKTPPNLAYILFTSGSTGEPKGVKVSCDALNNNIMGLSEQLGITSKDIWLSLTQITFDIFLLEVLLPLCFGGKLLFPSKEIITDFECLQKFVKSYNPTCFQTTPSLWKHFLEQGLALKALRFILVGGEPLSRELLHILLSTKKPVINLYGPTEATIWTTLGYLKLNEPVHIGRPISNTFCVVVNQFNQILPYEVAGELCIGGAGLAIGYLKSSQTKEAFINLPILMNKKERVYKTGDQVWMSSDGCIHFLERRDRQLKIRGQRIEPIEIESAICSSGLVENAVVMASYKDSQSLVAYLKTPNKKADAMKFSLFCFPEILSSKKNIFEFYKLLAKKADSMGFYGMWTPERHFNEIGSPFSAPSVVTAALAGITKKLILGAGSVVLPLHSSVAIAEQWATLDCLYPERIRLSVASGWHPDDFIFAPENYDERKKILFEKVKELKEIWMNGIFTGKNGIKESRSLVAFPRPMQAECPMWLTVADDIDVFAEAGQLGLNLLTHLLMQDVDSLSKKLEIYRKNLIENGYDPLQKQVTVMIHTYVHAEQGVAYNRAKKSLKNYFRAHLKLLEKMQANLNQNTESLSDEYFEALVEKFIREKCLIGTPKECESLLIKLQETGVTEIAAFVDFGLSEKQILADMKEILKLQTMLPELNCKNYCDILELRKILSKELSPGMIPNDFIFIDHMPLTIHGKTDFNELKSLLNKNVCSIPYEQEEQAIEIDYLTEEVLKIWRLILRRQNINMYVSFFDNGGHSLQAIELINKIYNKFSVKISLINFLAHPLISYLVDFIKKQRKDISYNSLE